LFVPLSAITAFVRQDSGAWMASVQEVIAAAKNIAFVEVHCTFVE
jgi:hypothetical protein